MLRTLRICFFTIILVTPLLIHRQFLQNYLHPKQMFFECVVLALTAITLWKFDYFSLLTLRHTLLLGGFFAWAMAISSLSNFPITSYHKVIYWFCGMLFVAISCQIFTRKHLPRIAQIFIVVVDIVALGAIVQWCGYEPFPVVVPGFCSSTLGNPNFVATFCGAMFVALLGYSLTSAEYLWQLALLWWVLLITGSRGVLLATSIAGIIWLYWIWRLFPQHFASRKIYCAIFIIIILAATWIPMGSKQTTVWNKYPDMAYRSIHDRILVWTSTYRAIKDKPWIGYGPESWQNSAFRKRTEFISEKGNELYLQYATHSFFLHAHNDYLEITAELGIIGLLLFLLVLYSMQKKAYQDCHHEKDFAVFARKSSHYAATWVILLHALVSFPLQTTVGFMAFLLHWRLSIDVESQPLSSSPNLIWYVLQIVFILLMIAVCCSWFLGNMVGNWS